MTAGRTRSKYGAVKTQVDGVTFDSKAEAKRYSELKLLANTGAITELKLQPKFVLAPSVKFMNSKRATPALHYSADFAYFDRDGRLIVEDVKGFKTAVYKIKRHLMKAMLGIEVSEVSR